MKTREFRTTTHAGSALYLLGIVAVLFAIYLVRALRGHPTEWFTWMLLLMTAAFGAANLAVSSRWRLPLRLIYIGSAIASGAGLLMAILHDRTA